MSGRANDIWVGTSGWSYDSWRGPFYPRQVAKKQWLSYYGQEFRSAEINSSFYRTPSLAAVHRWREAVPEGFVFAWKASKFITHWKRLSAKSRNSIDLLKTRLRALAPKVGPVLFQLPSHFKADRERLASFLKLLPGRYRYAFEFRDASWYESDILKLLADEGVSLCLSDHHEAPAPWLATAEHVYVRGHGPTGRYHSRYPGSTLVKWARAFAGWQKAGHTIYCYFDNDQKSAAPKDAATLQALVESGSPVSQRAARQCRQRNEAAHA